MTLRSGMPWLRLDASVLLKAVALPRHGIAQWRGEAVYRAIHGILTPMTTIFAAVAHSTVWLPGVIHAIWVAFLS